jgi:predicted HTH transcriptional regulator
MNHSQLIALLSQPESTGLDWKAAVPKGLNGPNSDLNWDMSRAEMLRDLASIANSLTSENGYLIYGVKDLGSSRKVIGISKQLDDADLQQWSENHFDPPIRFEFSLISIDSSVVGAVEIFPDPGRPHVVARTLRSAIFEGQVWFRRGTKNTIALRADLARFFVRPESLRVALNSPLVADVAKYYAEHGYRTTFARYLEKDSKNSIGRSVATDPITGAEIWAGGSHDRPELIMMKVPIGANR